MDRDQSHSNTDDDGDVVVEGEQDTGPTSAETPDPPTPMASTPEAEHTMEVEVSEMPQLTSRSPQLSRWRRMTCSRVIPSQ